MLKLERMHRPTGETFVDPTTISRQMREVSDYPFRIVLGLAYRGLTGGFLLLWNFSGAISVSSHVGFT